MMIKVYTDGSWREDKPSRSIWGFIAYDTQGNEVYAQRGSVPSYNQRQILGEMTAVIQAVKWAIKHGYTCIEIHYDLECLRNWYAGTYKTRNEYSRRYVECLERMQKCNKLIYRFVKEEAHTAKSSPRHQAIDKWIGEYSFDKTIESNIRIKGEIR